VRLLALLACSVSKESSMISTNLAEEEIVEHDIELF
jgi:hypothetical protein